MANPATQDCEVWSTILAELLALRADVAALRDDFELLAVRGRLSRDERALLVQLLPRAALLVGNTVFAASDLHDMPTLQELLAGYTLSATAWLLGRAAGARIAGFRVERLGTDRCGALWQLRGEVAARRARGCR